LEKNQLAALLAARGLPLTLAFAGDGPTRGPLMALARGLGIGNVRFLGRVAEMPRLYRAADVFFFPTLGENQSLATLEAMASGLPVITSPIPAQAELVGDGLEGRLVPPRPGMLRRTLADFLDRPADWARWGENARAHVARAHTLEDSADAFMAALGKALETWRMTGSSSAAA
jgi:glycosyltransferase involved in cell wall biosynthesis